MMIHHEKDKDVVVLVVVEQIVAIEFDIVAFVQVSIEDNMLQ
jgi:hypothetical protein